MCAWYCAVWARCGRAARGIVRCATLGLIIPRTSDISLCSHARAVIPKKKWHKSIWVEAVAKTASHAMMSKKCAPQNSRTIIVSSILVWIATKASHNHSLPPIHQRKIYSNKVSKILAIHLAPRKILSDEIFVMLWIYRAKRTTESNLPRHIAESNNQILIDKGGNACEVEWVAIYLPRAIRIYKKGKFDRILDSKKSKQSLSFSRLSREMKFSGQYTH